MSTRKQFCPRGHDTLEIGRDSSYRCLQCKREDARAARVVRREQEQAACRAEQTERNERLRRQHQAWLRRTGAVR